MANVKVYALSTCIHCRNTKKFLDENNIPYDCVEVDTLNGDEKLQAIEQIKRYNPAISFPTIVINGDRVVVGFRKDDLVEALEL